MSGKNRAGPTLRPRNNKRARVEEDVEDATPFFDKPVESIKDLVEIATGDVNYCNIDMKMLRRIQEPLVELNEMIGMDKLKESLFGQIIYYVQGMHKDSSDYLHTVLYGAPGTGKTTVARIIGRIFATIGVLSSRKFVIATREDLVSGYLGQTAMKTREVLEDCIGGVLFIDEIYSLNHKEKKDAFSKECIDTINLFLSENKDNFMLIVAGYEKEIEECFFAANPGLRRRFMWYHKIDKYSSGQLSDMFANKIAKIGWRLDEDVTSDWLTSFIKANELKIKYAGGDIENFITMCKIEHARRMFGNRDRAELKKLSRKDLQTTMGKFNNNAKEEVAPIPQGMYC